MSKVTYIWGAGASRGLRSKAENRGDKGYIIRGVPVISEFKDAIDDVIKNITQRLSSNNLQISTNNDISLLKRKMQALRKICIEFPTVDTYAKQLFITHATNEFDPIKDYQDLKQTLSLFLIMIQSVKKRDSRYDGFIASVISNEGKLPSTTILSWNYDVQFELAFSGYAQSLYHQKYIPCQWNSLNVLNKTYSTHFDVMYPFAMIKLNGTATFETNVNQNIDGINQRQIKDPFFWCCQ